MIKVQVTNMIDVDALDSLVIKTYNKPYNFQQQDGCKDRQLVSITVPDKADDFENDTIPEVVNGSELGVSFAAWLARDPKEWQGSTSDANYVDMFWERNFYPDLQMLANDLHTKGLWPAGEYMINIDW